MLELANNPQPVHISLSVYCNCWTEKMRSFPLYPNMVGGIVARLLWSGNFAIPKYQWDKIRCSLLSFVQLVPPQYRSEGNGRLVNATIAYHVWHASWWLEHLVRHAAWWLEHPAGHVSWWLEHPIGHYHGDWNILQIVQHGDWNIL